MSDQQNLREAVARAMWVASTSVRADMEDSVWDGTHPRADAYLMDGDYRPPDDDNYKPFCSRIGRNSFRRLADAAIAVALEEAARVAIRAGGIKIIKWDGTEEHLPNQGYRIAESIRALIPTHDGERG